jgi:hypothetical protein
MTVIPIKREDDLADLANKINVCAMKADDYRTTAACHLAEAKALCTSKGITFKDWVRDNIKFSYHEAVKLAIAGESDDPAKAIADMRAGDRTRKQAQRVVGRPTTETIEADDDEDDNEEAPQPGELPNSMRVRGFLYRAKEAAELARADDLTGVNITEAMRSAAADTAQAWIELLSKMEGH